MHPLLLEIPVFGGIQIYTYGALVALAFLTGIWWTTREAKLADVPKEFVLDLSFYIVLAALIGSRVLYILVDWRRYAEHPLDALKVWEGGLVFYGGLIGATLVSWFFIHKHRFSFLKIADLFMPGLVLGHAIGRLGCFAAGCCYGREAPADFPLAVIFPHSAHALAPAGVLLYPSQLFESTAAFCIFLILVAVRRKKSFDGQIFLIYLAIYSVARSVLEIFRGDEARGFLIPDVLSTSQFISLGLMLFAVALYIGLKKRSRAKRS